MVAHDRAVKAGSQHQAWHGKGLCMADLGRWPEARDCFAEAVRRAPRYLESTLWLARACARLNELAEAHSQVDRALKAFPNSDGAWGLKAVIHGIEQKHRDAIQAAEKALAINSKNVDAWLVKGHGLVALKEPGKGRACFEKVLALDPKNAEALAQKRSG